MPKRKTFQTMSLSERLLLRSEMVSQAERLIREQYPTMRRGAVRVKAYSFVEASLAKEISKQ